MILALDQGGHASRALVFGAEGGVIARAMREVSETRPAPDRVEQDPEEIVRSVLDAARAALSDPAVARSAPSSGARDAQVRAGLATQRSSLVAWDRADGAALTPVISWQDRRASAWMESIADRAAEIRARTGLQPSPHYGASKMRWCLEHVPAVARARAKGTLALGPLASFLAFRLCRERPFAVDPAHASRTLLWNLATRDWDPELCELFGVPREVLPRLVPTRGTFGTMELHGRSVPLEVVNGDQSCTVFAFGAPREDTAYVNVGTGAFVQRPFAERPADVPRLLTSLVYSEGARSTWVIEGTVNGAGSALAWIAKERGLADVERELAGWLERERDPPLFLNGVSGLAAPYWISDFRSRFVGAGSDAALVVAVLESALFLVARILEEMRAAADPPARIQASGGLARVDGLCRYLASVTGIEVVRAEEHEATATGLAWLVAGGRVGPLGHVESAAGASAESRAREASDRFAPRTDTALGARYGRWKRAMQDAVEGERARARRS